MQFGRPVVICLILVLWSGPTISRQAFAQRPAPPAENATDFDPAVWKALVQKKADAVARMTEISKAFQSASAEQQRELTADFEKIRDEFQGEVSPQMTAMAPAAYARNPKDIDAAEIMLQLAYSKNRFPEAAEIAGTIIEQNPQHALALNMGGVAEFARHDFEKSVAMLESAKQSGVLYPGLGGQYLDNARNYIDYWEAEQEIRRREAAATGNDHLPRVMMKTDKGDILLELFENEAPNTVANFVNLIERGYYDGIPFHRVISGFMAQGGMKADPAEAVDYTIKCECYQDNARRHFAGSLSMAKTQARDSGSAQFFLTHLPTPHLDKEVRPESVHTVFGRVVEGMDAVAAIEEGDKIISATVVRKRNHDYTPETLPADG